MKKYGIWILFLFINIMTFSNEQYIYSQIYKENLIVNEKYNVEDFSLKNENSVWAVGSGDISLKNFLSSTTTYEKTKFTRKENGQYSYNGTSKHLVKFILNKNIGSPKTAKFSLTLIDQSGDNPIYKKLIDETYTIPAPTLNFMELNLEASKNTFTYDEPYQLEHMIAFKHQEVVYRLYTGEKSENLIPLKKIQEEMNLENFYNSNDYVDFVFENNGTVQVIEKNGITGKYVDGKFEIMGLKEGKGYHLDLYTLRYRGNGDTINYVVTTLEGTLDFVGKNQSSAIENKLWLEDIDISNYKEIKLNILTITSDELSKVDLKNISEEREGVSLDISDISITTPTSLSGTSINIDGINYKIVDNQIVFQSMTVDVIDGKVTVGGIEYPVENDAVTYDGITYPVVDGKILIEEKKYVYKWIGKYDTKFIKEEGKNRKIKFSVEAINIITSDLSGSYIEPLKVMKDTKYPHQRIFFNKVEGENNNIKYNFKNQKYKMIDRILTPARYGYRQIKTIDYNTDLQGYLQGKSYTNKTNFNFINNFWNYTINEAQEGIVIEKTISDAKAEFVDEDGEKIVFYTDNIGSGISKVEEKGDKVVYNWNSGPNNTNGIILNYDKVMFRIIKKPTNNIIEESKSYSVGGTNYVTVLPLYYWNPYEKTNPINYLDDEKSIDVGTEEKLEGSLKMEAFLYGTNNGYNKNYVDLVLDANTDKDLTFSNTVISYDARTKSIRLIGMPIGDYIIEFYSIKKGHDGNYKVITYENYDTFKMDIPEIASEEFEKETNIQKIDFITTSTSGSAIQVNVNFITKMEREINLTANNLKSINLPSFKISEKNEGTEEVKGVEDVSNLKLEESTQKKFLFPLDIVFVIDNSGSMQNEIDAVKSGLSAFGQELYDRGFDVKYNLITFGPEQKSSRIGDWVNKVNFYDNDYMAIYKSKWFDGATLEGVTEENREEKEIEELIDAFNKISAGSGYSYRQENSAWGIHYAIEQLRANARYLDYNGEITSNSSNGYMPSEKMIIFLTDENMDTDNLPSGYKSSNVLQKLYQNLNSTYNGLADNINLTGLFHVKKQGNKTDLSASTTLKFYDEVPKLKYKYANGMRSEWSEEKWMSKSTWNANGYSNNPDYQFIRESWWSIAYRKKVSGTVSWEEYDDSTTPILGIIPSDAGEVSHTDFKLYNTGNNFFMYEMGSYGENVGKSLQHAINSIGVIQRWELSYLTPFNERDGTIRTVDFGLIDVKGKDGVAIEREIKDLDAIEDKQYVVQEEELVIKFKDPTEDKPKLILEDGVGVVKFLARSRYHKLNEDGKISIVEDIIKERSLNVLKPDGTLLFTRTTDQISINLLDDGWYELNVSFTADEMDILRTGGLGDEPLRKVKLEATVVTNMFTKTKVLEDVEVDVTPPKIIKVKVVNKTLREFLKSIKSFDNTSSIFTNLQAKKYSGYSATTSEDIAMLLTQVGSYVKKGDLLDVEIVVEEEDIDITDIYIAVDELGWGVPTITPNGTEFILEWKNVEVKRSSGTINIRNNIIDVAGNSSREEIGILNIDMTDITPTSKVFIGETQINPDTDGRYYLNDNYEINVDDTGAFYRAGILILESSDIDDNNEDPIYHKTLDGLFTGGIKNKKFDIKVDRSTHKMDGTYSSKIYGMSRSGKLIGITDYKENDIDTIIDANYNKISLESKILIVDTVAPVISEIKIINKTFIDKYGANSIDGNGNINVKNGDIIKISYKIEDSNVAPKEKVEGKKGGYSTKILGLNITEKAHSISGNIVTYTFIVNDIRTDLTKINIELLAEDKAGNKSLESTQIILANGTPKGVKIEIFEKVKGWTNITTGRGKSDGVDDGIKVEGYEITKGGEGSLVVDPKVYTKIKGTGVEVRYLKVEKNGASPTLLDIFGKTNEILIDGSNGDGIFIPNSVNEVQITPISISGVEGTVSKTLKFLVDTKVNTSYLQGGIIGSLEDDKIRIDLSKIEELSGIDGYKYELLVDGEIKAQGGEANINGNSAIIKTKGSISSIIEIDISSLPGGSRGELAILLWDRLGHEKELKKTYFIPTKTLGIRATVEGESKIRKSKIKIIGEGEANKFDLESSVDGSTEE